MFNSYNAGTLNLKFNSVSGTLVKSHPKSFFVHRSSSGWIFDDKEPSLKRSGSVAIDPVVVLQVMVIGENSLLCEVVRRKDWEEAQNA